MRPKEQNDYFYVCSSIEYIARETKNKRGTIVNLPGKKGIEKQLYDAEVNHCLSFEQVSDELIEFYKIPEGDIDTISSHSTNAIAPNKAYLWSRSKVWMRAGKRTFKPPRLKSQICLIGGNGFVCSLLNELNSYLTNSFTEAYTPLPSKPYFSISLTAGPDSP